MTKLAPITPAFCASCFQAGPEKRYVDFDAAWDGPVMTLPDGRKQPIDDLVICENCLNEAFDLLDPKGLKNRVAELEGLVERMQADIDAKDGQVQRLGATVDELIRHPIERQPGFSGPGVGVPPEVAAFLRERKKIRMKPKKERAPR